MPSPGVANNPDGTNGFDGFGTEAPYGQGTQDARLASGAPIAGGGIASGPIAAPKRAQKQSAKPAVPQPASGGMPEPPQPTVQSPSPVAQLWAGIAADPGASELVRSYAQQAAVA